MPHPQTIAGSKVISFPPLGDRVKRIVREETAERGTILLFTGVRYQRIEDEADEADHETERARRRDDFWS